MAANRADGNLDDARIIPVVEERAVVRKRRKVTGAVRVRTVVREDEATVAERLAAEEVEVDRAPVDRWVDEPEPVRQEGDVTIIPVHEEVVVVEKRLRVVEEIRLTKRRTARDVTEQVTLRREEAVVEHLDAPAADDVGGDSDAS